MTAANGTLSIVETSELAQCETVIERGMSTFREVGNALARIRQGRLYRDQYDSFETYSRAKWNMSGTHAHRLIDSASVVENLKDSPIGELPKSESVARELSKVPKEKQREGLGKGARTAQGKPDRGRCSPGRFPDSHPTYGDSAASGPLRAEQFPDCLAASPHGRNLETRFQEPAQKDHRMDERPVNL